MRQSFVGRSGVEILFETWNGPVYRAFRRSLSTDHPSEYCATCLQAGYRGVDHIENHIRIFSREGEIIRTS